MADMTSFKASKGSTCVRLYRCRAGCDVWFRVSYTVISFKEIGGSQNRGEDPCVAGSLWGACVLIP